MKRLLVTGAGGAPATNFVRSLRLAPEEFHLIGVDCDKYYLQRAETDERYLVPKVLEDDYLEVLKEIIVSSGAELAFAQPDVEIPVISRHRDDLGVRTFLPRHETVEICQNKVESYRRWKAAGLKVPQTMLIRDAGDLRRAFGELGNRIWLREISGAFGKGSFPTGDFQQALAWIEFQQGWGRFSAAECLEPQSTTWQSIWWNGELVVAQGRKRLYWEFANRAPSGVTGITGTGVTISDPVVDEVALNSILAIDSEPHGVFSVDLTYDAHGVPNPTEINIGRFFTTHLFFSTAGVNMPYVFVKLAFGEEPPAFPRKINPLPPGLAWVRGMDVEPVLTTLEAIDQYEAELEDRRARLRKMPASASRPDSSLEEMGLLQHGLRYGGH